MAQYSIPILFKEQIEKEPRDIETEKVEKTMVSFGQNGLNIKTCQSKKGGNQVSGRVSIPCWHAGMPYPLLHEILSLSV